MIFAGGTGHRTPGKPPPSNARPSFAAEAGLPETVTRLTRARARDVFEEGDLASLGARSRRAASIDGSSARVAGAIASQAVAGSRRPCVPGAK